jgi:ribosome-associated translation inhibitor RaiA
MKNPLEVTFHDLRHNEEIELIIKEKFEKVIALAPDVTKCHIILEKQSKHHQKANQAYVSLDLKAPHFEDIVITEDCLEDVASLKSAVIKVFKHGLDLMHKHKSRRRDQKRLPLGQLSSIDPIEEVD